MKNAYTTKEMATLLGISPKSVLVRAEREGWKSQQCRARGGGNEWLVSSMPESTRAAIAAALVAATPAAPPTLAASDIVIPDWSFEMGKARARIVFEWRAFVARAAKKGTPKMVAVNDFYCLLEAGHIVPMKTLKTIGKYSIKTIYKWDKLLRENGDNLEALADKRGKWSKGGAKGLGQLGAEVESLLLSTWLTSNKLSVAQAHRAVAESLKQKGQPVPSYTSARRFLERFDRDHHDVVVFRREGEKAYADQIGPYLSRNDQILQVGDVLVADGHRMNIMVINPATGQPCRMTLIGWQDWASRMFVAFEIMLDENTQAIAASFHRALLNLGKKCKVVYKDNGKAFKNMFFDGDPDLDEHDGLYLRLGIDTQHSAPYVARAKLIERWWGDFDRQCARMLDSYVGANIDDKPAHLHRNEKWHKDRREKLGQNRVPTIEEVTRIVTEYAKWKALQPHPTRPDTTPWEMFQAGRGPGFTDAEQADLARHFLHRKRINPARCRFTLYNIEYESDVLDVLHGLNKPLMAHYAYSNLSEVYLYDEGRFVGMAHPVSTVNPLAAKFGTDLDVQTIKGKLKDFSALRRDTRKLAANLDTTQAALLMGMNHMAPAAERRVPLTLHHGRKSLDAPQTAAPALTDSQRKELESFSADLKQAKATAASTYQKPAYFASKRERYEFLFDISYMERKTLEPDDAAFVAEFEGSPEYALAAQRYDALKKMFEKQRVKEATA